MESNFLDFRFFWVDDSMLYEGHWFQFKGEARSNFLIVDRKTLFARYFFQSFDSLQENTLM